MDLEALHELVGRKVAVRLKNVEAGGVEIVATLDDVRGDGIVLRDVGDLGPGTTMFCPWESLHRVRRRPPWLAPPHEGEDPEGSGSFEQREVSEENAAPRPPTDHRAEPSARTLERVVSVAQTRTVRGVAVASLEIYGEGVGILHWRASLGEKALRDEPDLWYGAAEPVLKVRDGSGRELAWSPGSGGGHNGESGGGAEIWDLPKTGELRVEVVRLAVDAYGPDGDYRGEGASVNGPWSFAFSL